MCGIGTAILLGGCATLPPPKAYIAPTDGDTARLFIKGNLSADWRSRFDTFVDSETCTDPRAFAETSDGRVDTSIEIAAEQPFTVRLFQQMPGALCTYIATFDPKKDHRYYLEPFNREATCGLFISDVTTGVRVLEPSTRKRTEIYGPTAAACEVDKKPKFIKPVAKKPSLDDLRDLLPEAGP